MIKTSLTSSLSSSTTSLTLPRRITSGAISMIPLRLITTFRRSGRGWPIERHVAVPITMVCPVVVCLKNFRSILCIESKIDIELSAKPAGERSMMGGRSWDEWVDEYSESHQHPINRLMHTFGIPMIVLSVVLIVPSFFVSGLWRIALGLFVVGWILQFIGHYFEGKPPEFLKDYRFLFVGTRWWIKKTFG